MTQVLYAHMNSKTIKIKKKKLHEGDSFPNILTTIQHNWDA
jgi:hypothetical protein